MIAQRDHEPSGEGQIEARVRQHHAVAFGCQGPGDRVRHGQSDAGRHHRRGDQRQHGFQQDGPIQRADLGAGDPQQRERPLAFDEAAGDRDGESASGDQQGDAGEDGDDPLDLQVQLGSDVADLAEGHRGLVTVDVLAVAAEHRADPFQRRRAVDLHHQVTEQQVGTDRRW